MANKWILILPREVGKKKVDEWERWSENSVFDLFVPRPSFPFFWGIPFSVSLQGFLIGGVLGSE